MSVHPAAWVAWTLCGGLVALSTTNPFYLLVVFAAAWVVHAAHRHAGPGVRSFRIFAAFGLLTIATRTALVFLGPVSRGSVVAAMLEGARLAVMLVVYGTFNSVSDPWRLMRLAPRRFHEPALASVLALSIAPRMIDAGLRVREAQRLRGIQAGRLRNLPALAVPVLSTGMEEAVTLAESMDARGHGCGRRSHYRIDPWNLYSWVTVLAGIVPLVCVALMLRSGAQLLMPAYPLAWPEVSPWAVAALVGLALPAAIPPRHPDGIG